MKVILVCGARPNFMKIAPLIRAIEKHNQSAGAGHQSPIAIRHVLVHTGQHYDYKMSQVFFQELKLPEPDIHLGAGSGTHAEQTAKVLIEFERVAIQEKPDLVVVVGDVNSTLAAALAAVKLHIPVAHVEAGLRSYDRTLPEEINRVLTDHMSDILFTTSGHDDDNLKREGVPAAKVFCVGNIMADSLLASKEMAAKSAVLSHLHLAGQGYALLTLHRTSNVDDRQRLAGIVGTVRQVAEKLPVVFPVHPRTQQRLKDFGLLDQSQVTSHSLLIVEPLGYLDFLNLEMNARFVITDSGGVQVETTVLGVPCLAVLDTPLWPITESEGTNILVGTDSGKMLREVGNIMEGSVRKGSRPVLWDGRTAERIVAVVSSARQKKPSG